MVRRYLLLVASFCVIILSSNNAPAQAVVSSTNHMHCTVYGDQSNPALKSVNVVANTRAGDFWNCLSYSSGQNPTPGALTPTPICPTALYLPRAAPPGINEVYNQLRLTPGQTSSTLTATTLTTSEGTLSCQVTLSCQNSCIPPQSFSCDGYCNIVPNAENGCPGFGSSSGYSVSHGGGSDITVTWDDGTETSINGALSPAPVNVDHTFANPGVYDIKLNCSAGRTCTKRVNVTCQASGGGPTPTPLPTASPTPTGVAVVNGCTAPQSCSHPCSCQGASGATHSSCLGSLGGVVGASCGPGLICCNAQPTIAVTPTGGITPAAWIKTGGASVMRRGNMVNTIPSTAERYDSSDVGLCQLENPPTHSCLVGYSAGAVVVNGSSDYGYGTVSYQNWEYSSNPYTPRDTMTPLKFIEYVKARRQYHDITTDGISGVQTNQINFSDNDVTVDNNGLAGNAPAVIVVDGNLTFDISNTFNPSNQPLTFVVSGTVNIPSSLGEINAIIIAQDVDFASDIADGSTTDEPLKINGNLISFTDSVCSDKRERTDDTDQPSCFFRTDIVNQYLPVLPLMSTRIYQYSEPDI